MPEKPLHRELQYFIAHQDDLVREYGGKIIVIKDDQVIGVFDSVAEAVEETAKQHRLGSFLVQRCDSGELAYTRTFWGHRVAPSASKAA